MGISLEESKMQIHATVYAISMDPQRLHKSPNKIQTIKEALQPKNH